MAREIVRRVLNLHNTNILRGPSPETKAANTLSKLGALPGFDTDEEHDNIADLINTIKEEGPKTVEFSPDEIDNAIKLLRERADPELARPYINALLDRRRVQTRPAKVTRRGFFGLSLELAGDAAMLSTIPVWLSEPGFDYGSEHTTLTNRLSSQKVEMDRINSKLDSLTANDPSNKTEDARLKEEFRTIKEESSRTSEAKMRIEYRKTYDRQMHAASNLVNPSVVGLVGLGLRILGKKLR